LANAKIVDTLDEALEGLSHLCATAMTPRDFGPPTVAPRAHFEALAKTTSTAASAPEPSASQQGVGFLFGSERFGMRNEDVYRCHVCLSIPSNPLFGSLNIGAALQVIAYEWRLALGGFDNASASVPSTIAGGNAAAVMADAAQVAGMLGHLEQSLVALGFLDPAAPKKLMPRLNQLFNRAGVTQEEVHILRGIAKAVLQQSAAKSQP
jgi:tRNA/rRNA methyltransferase